MNRDPIKVLHIRYTDRLCGPGRIILGNIQAKTQGDIRYYAAAFLDPGRTKNEFLEQVKFYCPVLNIPTVSRLDFGPLRILRSFIRRNGIDLIHAHDYKSSLFGFLAGKMEGLPVVATAHGWIKNNSREKMYFLLDLVLFRLLDAIIAVSRRKYEELLAYKIKKEKLWLIPNAVVMEEYSSRPNPPMFRKELDVTPDLILVGNVGRLSAEKGQKDFIRAARCIAAKHPKARFVIIGEGPDGADLETNIKMLGLSDRVFLAGYRRDMSDVYHSLDLLVLSSKTEGLPMVILEAMASKTPVVATHVGGVSEVVIDKKTGILVPPQSVEALARSMDYAISNRSAMEQMAQAAFHLVSEQYTFAKNSIKTVLLYQTLTRRARNQ